MSRTVGRSILLVLVLIAAAPSDSPAAELSQATSRAFDAYLQAFEKQVSARDHFLLADENPGAREELKGGRVIILHILPKQEPPNGMLHHWRGAIFVPGASLGPSLAQLQDYDASAKHFRPEVIDSRLLHRDGNDFLMRQRWMKKKIITVILETEHAVHYRRIDEARAESTSQTTKISEVENAGKANESVLPPGQGSGFIWRMNTYWRYLQADGGLYVEIDAISLSRALPPLIGAIIRPIIEDLPEQSLGDTLRNVRKLLASR